MSSQSFEMVSVASFNEGENNMNNFSEEIFEKIFKLISESDKYAPSPVNLFKLWPCQNDGDKISMKQKNLTSLRKVRKSCLEIIQGECASLFSYLKQALEHYSCALELNIQGSTFFKLNKSHIELAFMIVKEIELERGLCDELSRIQDAIKTNSKIGDLNLLDRAIGETGKSLL